jgi:ADP-heptose:LPS heptosyltransferase
MTLRGVARALRAQWYAHTERSCVPIPPASLGERPRILVVRDDCLGDVMTTLPAIATLKVRYPYAEIDCLVKPGMDALLRGNKSVSSTFTHAGALAKEYDCAIAFAPGAERNRFLARVGAPVRIGWGGCGGAASLTHIYRDDRDDRPRHEVVSCLEMAALAGASDQAREMRVVVPQATLYSAPYVVIHAGASKSYLRWPVQKYAALAQRMCETFGWRAVFSGSKADAGLQDVLRKVLPVDERYSFEFDQPLSRLAAVYAGARMYVGNLTGPMHLAAACGLPCVAVSVMKDNRDDARYWAPWGVPYRIANDPRKLIAGHPADYRAAAAIAEVSVDIVFDAVCALHKETHG